MTGHSAAIPGTRAAEYHGRITPYIIFTCITAASGGLMYGYDLVVAGGVSSMDDFLEKFYPSVLISKRDAKQTNYCKYNNEVFQLFSSSLYMAGLTSTLFASVVTKRFGRRTSMLIAGLLFDAGTILSAGAQNLGMLISGRVLLGAGIGFANQAIPVFLSEMAPAKLRGGLNFLFTVNVTIGILAASLVNYGTANLHPYGWRVSLGLAGLPAMLLTIGSLLLVETPNSLIERGYMEEAKAVLRRIRGTDKIEAEFEDMLEASQISQQVKSPLRNLLRRRNRPQLILGFAFPFFQQLCGNDAILFYGPFLFKTAGFGDNAALYSAVITGVTNMCSTITSMFLVDRVGRRKLLLYGSTQMFVAQVAVATMMGLGLRGSGAQQLSHTLAIMVVVMICVFVNAFGLSWGPLAWLVPTEIYPLEARSAGQSLTVCVNMLFKFVIAQTFLSMLCVFKFGIFLFFAGWVLVMFLFTLFLIPETKGIPIEEMVYVWRQHWFWKNIVPSSSDDDKHNGKGNNTNANQRSNDRENTLTKRTELATTLP